MTFESSALRAIYRVRTEACIIRKVRTPASQIDMAVSETRIVRIPARYTRAGYITVIVQVAVTASSTYLARNLTEDAALP